MWKASQLQTEVHADYVKDPGDDLCQLLCPAPHGTSCVALRTEYRANKL